MLDKLQQKLLIFCMDKKLKIAIFTDCFFPATGGTENVIKTLVPLFQKLGDKVRIYAPNYHIKGVSQDLPGYDVYRLKSIKLTDNDNITLIDKKFIKNVKEFAPDIIYFVTGAIMAKWAIKLGQKLGVPVVATLHTKFEQAWYNSTKSHIITNFMIRNLAKYFNNTTMASTLSQDAVRTLKKYGYKYEPVFIQNGINKQNTTITPFELNIPKNRFNFLFCGRLEKIKNLDFTLKVLKNLVEKYSYRDFNFLLAGSGSYENNLKRKVNRYGLKDNVFFLGQIRDKSKLNYVYSISNLLLFPSTFEMDSLVVIEASVFNLPTLALNGYACGERIIDNQTGFLSEYDLNAYANRIWEIVNDKKLYDYVKNNSKNLKASSWEEIAKQYQKFFIDAINKYQSEKK